MLIGVFQQHFQRVLLGVTFELAAIGGADQLVSQIIGVVAIAAFVLVTSGILFFVLKSTIGLRVSEEEEVDGLDVHEHGAPGYSAAV